MKQRNAIIWFWLCPMIAFHSSTCYSLLGMLQHHCEADMYLGHHESADLQCVVHLHWIDKDSAPAGLCMYYPVNMLYGAVWYIHVYRSKEGLRPAGFVTGSDMFLCLSEPIGLNMVTVDPLVVWHRYVFQTVYKCICPCMCSNNRKGSVGQLCHVHQSRKRPRCNPSVMNLCIFSK